jgi:hypothetical protein
MPGLGADMMQMHKLNDGLVWGKRMKLKTLPGAALLLLVLGCSPLTQENYSKITVGMSYDEVTTLIGKPDSCDDVMGVRNCMWGDETRSVQVGFVAEKALLFSANNLK